MRSLTQQHLAKHPEKRERFARVYIWSGEHGAWWRPECSGYTDAICAAGVYTMEYAWAKTRHCGREKKITYQEAP